MIEKPENSTSSFRKSKKDLLFLAGVCVAALCLVLPIWLSGIPRGNDLPQHFQFAVTIFDALQAGDYYPAWMPNENKGYGGVGLRFYPPVPYYALALGKMLAGNWFNSACLVFWFWLALSGVGAYFWARERFGEAASFVGALVYIAAPYHINELYNAFTYAEFAAVAVLPFCFLFVDRLMREAKFFNFCGLAVSFALLAMCNLPIAVMGTLSLGIYTLASLPRKDLLGTAGAAVRAGGAFIFGAALCAFFWFKIVTEMAWLNHSAEGYATDSMFYDYKVNFLLMCKYLATWNFDDRDMWFADLVLLATLALFIPLLIVFWASARSFASQRLGRVVILFLFGMFMATPLSTPVWDNISTIQKIQFPWRWMAIITLSGIPMAAAGWSYCAGWLKTGKRPYSLIVFGCMIFGVVFTYSQIIKQATYHTREEFETLVATLGEAQNFDCWFTVWAKEDALKIQDKVTASSREVSGLTWQRKERDFTIAAGEPAKVRLATFYHPYWQVSVNDAPVKAYPAEDGALSFDAPPDEAKVNVKFTEPVMTRAFGVVSIACWLALLGSALFSIFRNSRQRAV